MALLPILSIVIASSVINEVPNVPLVTFEAGNAGISPAAKLSPEVTNP
jgi:hypothetical protein